VPGRRRCRLHGGVVPKAFELHTNMVRAREGLHADQARKVGKTSLKLLARTLQLHNNCAAFVRGHHVKYSRSEMHHPETVLETLVGRIVQPRVLATADQLVERGLAVPKRQRPQTSPDRT
jgi:hypothetical protein